MIIYVYKVRWLITEKLILEGGRVAYEIHCNSNVFENSWGLRGGGFDRETRALCRDGDNAVEVFLNVQET